MKRRKLPPETLLAFLDVAHVEGVCVQWPTPGRNPSGSNGSEGPAAEAVRAIVAEAARRGLGVTTASAMTDGQQTTTPTADIRSLRHTRRDTHSAVSGGATGDEVIGSSESRNPSRNFPTVRFLERVIPQTNERTCHPKKPS